MMDYEFYILTWYVNFLFKGNCNMYNIQSIFCTYHITNERARTYLHEYVDELVESWNSYGEAPLVIVEAVDLLDSIKILSGSPSFFSHLFIISYTFI